MMSSPPSTSVSLQTVFAVAWTPRIKKVVGAEAKGEEAIVESSASAPPPPPPRHLRLHLV